MNILIIDDDADDTTFFCEVLKDVSAEIGCVVENNFNDVNKTFAFFTKDPEFIFIDGLMFPVGGKECLKQVKARLGNNSRTRIVIYSGYVSVEQIQEFKSLGADEVMIKANSFKGLKTYLEELFKKYPFA